jgi:hypothetical protein
MFCGSCGRQKNFTTVECDQGLHQNYQCPCEKKQGIGILGWLWFILVFGGFLAAYLIPLILKGISP